MQSTTTTSNTFVTAKAGQKVERKQLPLEVLFTVGILLGFVVDAILTMAIFPSIPGIGMEGSVIAALAFGAVGGASGLLAVGLYDVIINGSLEDKA